MLEETLYELTASLRAQGPLSEDLVRKRVLETVNLTSFLTPGEEEDFMYIAKRKVAEYAKDSISRAISKLFKVKSVLAKMAGAK